MSQVAAWFERKFEFTFPVEFYPNLATRLRGTPARLEETLRGSSHEMLVRKEQGKWSPQEHAGHLLDLEPLWAARVEDFVKGGTELTSADLKNQKTHDANHNARPVEQILADFRRSRMALMTRLATMQPEQFSRTMLHPRLKQPMRLVDHLYFAAEHDDHHLARIWEMLHSSGR
jgi:uncharacterized damage-inducible protein DinB